MNRQRRLEAIARRRAFIDSQIQMLSSTEVRLPNIIRNRTGRPLPARPKTFQTVEYVENKGNDFSVASHYKQTASKLSLNNNDTQLSQVGLPQSFKIGQSSSSEDVYVALGDGEDGEQGQVTLKIEGAVEQHEAIDGSFPITLSEEIAKMLASATGTTEQLIRTLKTIQTEDGTVMVVLEGNNFTENETDVTDGSAISSDGNEQHSESLLHPTPAPVPVTDNEVRCDKEMRTEFEESYLIVQTPEGDVLVPSSKICPQFQTPPVSSEESIVHFVATESGAIENLITSKNSTDLPNKKRPAVNNRRVTPIVPQKQNKLTSKNNNSAVGAGAAKRPIVKNASTSNSNGCKDNLSSHPKVLKKKNNAAGRKLVNNVSQSSANALTGSPTPIRSVFINSQEKPRPFRFELPELEDCVNGLDDCFMTVPVPIKIDSLRSQTRKGKIETKVKLESSLFQFSVTTTTEKSTSSDLEKPDKDVVEDNVIVEPSSQNILQGQIEEFSQETQMTASVITCQQCNQQFSSELNLLNHKQTGSCNSFIQCLQCFSIFSNESSFSNHLDNCSSGQQNNNMNVNVSSVSMEVDRELDSETAEENLIIKSVNSLSTPTINITNSSASEATDKTKMVISSPLDSNGNVDASIHVSSSPVVFVSSSDFNSKNENLVSFCVQLVDDSSEKSNSTELCSTSYADNLINVPSEFLINSSEDQTGTHFPKPSYSLDNSTEAVTVVGTRLLDSVADIGRRTLNKATAKANMSSDIGDRETWSPSKDEKGEVVAFNESEDINGNSGRNIDSIQSARIRSRNDRIKAMDKNKTNEEELGFNFRSIFEQVVKQSIPFN